MRVAPVVASALVSSKECWVELLGHAMEACFVVSVRLSTDEITVTENKTEVGLKKASACPGGCLQPEKGMAVMAQERFWRASLSDVGPSGLATPLLLPLHVCSSGLTPPLLRPLNACVLRVAQWWD